MVAVEKGQGDVQDHQLGVKGGELLQHVLKVLALPDLIAPAAQVALHHVGDDGVVLHNKNTVHSTPPLLPLEHSTHR